MMFDKIVYGPVHSRRLGISLGVNLLPQNGKICSFDCIYCECGFNKDNKSDTKIPTFNEVTEAIKAKLINLQEQKESLDVITFAGNGEPTLHPDFEKVIDETIKLRDQYFTTTKISVLTNGMHVGKQTVFSALNKIDNNILKLDAGINKTAILIDQPISSDYSIEKQIELYKKFEGKFILQTIFLSGEFNNNIIDNTTDIEVKAWLNVVKKLKPHSVMIYTIDRKTPAKQLNKATPQKLKEIAKLVNSLGIKTIIAT